MNNSDYKILIVDDEEDLAEICSETFEMEEFKSKYVLSAQAGLDEFNGSDQIHVIISDAHMPGMSGLEFLEAIKKSDKALPLFYLCTGDIEVTEPEIISQGGQGLIVKPYELNALLERITNDIKAKFL